MCIRDSEPSALNLDSINLDERDETGALTLRLNTTSGGQLSWVDDPALTFTSTNDELEVSGDAAAINNYLSGAVISYLHPTPNIYGQNADQIMVSLDYDNGSSLLGDINVHISPVNDAPSLFDGALGNIPEDTVEPNGEIISIILEADFQTLMEHLALSQFQLMPPMPLTRRAYGNIQQTMGPAGIHLMYVMPVKRY